MATAVTAPPVVDTVPANMCVQMVDAVARSCQPAAPVAIPPAAPSDGVADSLAALSTAFTFGSILLAIIALIGAVAWGFLVKVWAEREARAEAQRLAKECADEWMAKHAPAIIQKHVQFLRDTSVGDDDDDKAADDIGKEA